MTDRHLVTAPAILGWNGHQTGKEALEIHEAGSGWACPRKRAEGRSAFQGCATLLLLETATGVRGLLGSDWPRPRHRAGPTSARARNWMMRLRGCHRQS